MTNHIGETTSRVEMNPMLSSSFVDFYRCIHHQEPYPWQVRLADHVLEEGRFPSVISLPTGSGKTAVVDIAIFALALRPDLFPRRIVFVIDRRIVVDQVYDRVGRILQAIKKGEATVLREIKNRLSALSEAPEPIGYVSLRGGTHIDGEWAHRIDQPWVIVSTVDHYGSRLLFRGYGVSKRMRSIHAGLTGNDCLVVLDEVHLSVPFRDTLRNLEQYQAKSADHLPNRFQVVEMSATMQKERGDTFTLVSSDLIDAPLLEQKMRAPRRAELVEIGRRADLAGKVSRVLKTLKQNLVDAGELNSPRCYTVGVVVNRVQSAKEIKDALVELDIRTYLVIGRMRPIDKARVVQDLLPYVTTDRKVDETGLIVVVSTQAIEVGADFDFDHLITECSPIDCLRQRFGRLDRQGINFERNGEPTTACIVGIKNELRDKDIDPIYGSATKSTWFYLREQAEKGGFVNFGPMHHSEPPNECLAPRRTSPLLLPTYIESWTQTNPDPGVQPKVDWFLHGIDTENQSEPEVSIVWRWDRSTEALKQVPIRQAEVLDLPITAVKSWLGLQDDFKQSPTVDAVNDVTTSSYAKYLDEINDVEIERWNDQGQDSHVETARLADVRPGDMILINPAIGGLQDGVWTPDSFDPVTDFGDIAQLEYGKCATLRLDDRILDWQDSPPRPSDEVDSVEPLGTRIQRWLDNFLESLDSDPQYVEIVKRLKLQGFIVSRGSNVSESGSEGHMDYYVLKERARSAKSARVDESYMDDAGESGSMTGTGVTLRSHLEGVATRTERTARALGINDDLIADLRLAAELHDIGKVDARFQLKLVGGDRIRQLALCEPLGKSVPNCPRTSVYPRGMRHEVASLALIDSNMKVLKKAHDEELVLHLIGSHHGWCRPLPWIAEDEAPVILSYVVSNQPMVASSDQVGQGLALDCAHRFWTLNERYGCYGLAWLESVVRLSDHLQSAAEGK